MIGEGWEGLNDIRASTIMSSFSIKLILYYFVA